jgi:hypothetical protein
MRKPDALTIMQSTAMLFTAERHMQQRRHKKRCMCVGASAFTKMHTEGVSSSTYNPHECVSVSAHTQCVYFHQRDKAARNNHRKAAIKISQL